MNAPVRDVAAWHRREELADGVTLYLGDALQIIPVLDSHDHVFTDPPYEAHMHDAKQSARGVRTDGYASPLPVDFASIDGIRTSVTPLLIGGCERWLIIFCTPEGIAPWRDQIEVGGARYKRALFWYKPDSAPQFNGQGPAMAVECLVSAWCDSGHSSWNGGGRRNLFSHITNQPDRHGVHPTEKPVPLMAEIVDLFSNAGETILDPFMGSGSTGVAAIKRGRRFTGIEIDPRYFDIACKRVSDALKRPDLFIHVPELKQERLFNSVPGVAS